jgi:hypothetical protein
VGSGRTVAHPSQQIDEIVRWFGERQVSPATEAPMDLEAVSAWIRALIDRRHPSATIEWLMQTREFDKFLSKHNADGFNFGLTFAGWARLEELRRSVTDSRDTFMAMKFGDAGVDLAVENCFKPAALRRARVDIIWIHRHIIAICRSKRHVTRWRSVLRTR